MTPSDVGFATPLEERPGNITDSSFTGLLLQKMGFIQEETKFKNYIIERLFTTNSFLHDNQFFLVNLSTLKFCLGANQINQIIHVIYLWVTVV